MLLKQLTAAQRVTRMPSLITRQRESVLAAALGCRVTLSGNCLQSKTTTLCKN